MFTSQACSHLQAGFQLVELMIVMAILVIVGLIAVPSYSGYMDDVNRVTAVADITDITIVIEQHFSGTGEYPNTLAEIGKGSLLDPWGNTYYYMKIAGAPSRGRNRLRRGRLRKDKNLSPVNSDYDLYSAGKNELTRPPFPPKVSHDDIVRASNGKFIGYAADF